MNRRDFLKTATLGTTPLLTGCLESEGPSLVLEAKELRTTIDIDGENAIWTWIGHIELDNISGKQDIRADITLYDSDHTELATTAKQFNEVSPYKDPRDYEISYIDTPELIQRIYTYDIELTLL